jgi:uncharacterized protein
LRIAIDIDSTLHDYWPQLAHAAKKRFGVDLPYEQQLTWEIVPLRREQVKVLVEETHKDDNVLAAEPYAGAVETIRRWKEQGHFILIASHRHDRARGATTQWLERIGLPYDELYCSFDKISRCEQIGIDLLVDDSPRNIERALDAGIRAATPLHPWNRDICETEDVICAEDWPELARRLEPVLA